MTVQRRRVQALVAERLADVVDRRTVVQAVARHRVAKEVGRRAWKPRGLADALHDAMNGRQRQRVLPADAREQPLAPAPLLNALPLADDQRRVLANRHRPG